MSKRYSKLQHYNCIFKYIDQPNLEANLQNNLRHIEKIEGKEHTLQQRSV